MDIVVVVKEKESLVQSAYKDLVSFGFMAFCIYISQGSTFWTFVSGLLFLIFFFIKLGAVIQKAKNTFNNPEDAKAFIDTHYK